jgi:uncharacterized membrane protein
MKGSLVELFYQHKGKIIGSLVGFFVAWLIVTYGFFKALFIFICIAAGFYLGNRYDLDQGLGGFIERFISSEDR